MKRLLLIGGAAGAGKTTTARAVAKTLGAGWLQTDSMWIAMRQALPPGSPDRDALEIDTHIRSGNSSPDELVTQHMAAAEVICRALPPVLEFELQTHDTLVCDGVWLLPSFAAGLSPDGIAVRFVLIHEPEAHEVKRAMRSRSTRPATTSWQARGAEMSWLFGNHLQSQAIEFGLPVVAARPRETLLHRVLAATEPDRLIHS